MTISDALLLVNTKKNQIVSLMEQLQFKTEELNSIKSNPDQKDHIKEALIESKKSPFIGISFRNTIFSVTLNSEINSEIYQEVINNFIDALLPKIDMEKSAIILRDKDKIILFEKEINDIQMNIDKINTEISDLESQINSQKIV